MLEAQHQAIRNSLLNDLRRQARSLTKPHKQWLQSAMCELKDVFYAQMCDLDRQDAEDIAYEKSLWNAFNQQKRKDWIWAEAVASSERKKKSAPFAHRKARHSIVAEDRVNVSQATRTPINPVHRRPNGRGGPLHPASPKPFSPKS